MLSELKGWREIPIGGVCWKPSSDYMTGDWRTYAPIIDENKCTRCMLCVIYCPDAAMIYVEEQDRIKVDYDHCKGCGICAHECPANAIEMRLE